MESQVVSDTDARRARIMQRVADGLCYARMAAGPLIGAYIAKERNYRSWKTAGLIGALALTDYFDGKLARKAASIDKRVESPAGAWRDQMADKAFTHGIIGGMIVNVARTNKTYAAVLAVDQLTQLGRDIWITSVRKSAAEHEVPTNAQRLGKIKTGALLTSCIAMASPLADYEVGEAAAVTGITAGSILSIVSGVSLNNSLKAGIEVAEQLGIEEEPALLPPTLSLEA